MKQKRRQSVSHRVNGLLLFLVLAIAGGLIAIAYWANTSQVDEFYRVETVETAASVSSLLNGDRIGALRDFLSTPEYQEFEERAKDRAEDDSAFVTRFMQLFQEAGKMRTLDPASSEAQDLVKRLQNFITENMYTCSDEVLSGLGRMYSAGGEFTKNIDSWGGEGTGAFVDAAIQIYCAGKK